MTDEDFQRIATLTLARADLGKLFTETMHHDDALMRIGVNRPCYTGPSIILDVATAQYVLTSVRRIIEATLSGYGVEATATPRQILTSYAELGLPPQIIPASGPIRKKRALRK